MKNLIFGTTIQSNWVKHHGSGSTEAAEFSNNVDEDISSMKYRPDIDGLRAIAVLAVFFFHARVAHFSGGFVGVDLFFVVSGYLITSILLAESKSGRTNYFGFIYRRARRIAPALLVVLVVTLPFAWKWLFPLDMMEYAKTFFPAALFFPNIQLAGNVRYSQVAIDAHPLIHTWTLGVEAQFYLLFPIVFMVLNRWMRKALPIALGVLALLSFGAMMVHNYERPAATFYLLQYRGWEFLAGALVATMAEIKPFRGRGLLGLLGLSFVMVTFFIVDENTPFPSGISILPVTGAALIIAFSAPKTLVYRLLTFKPMIGLGLISYSFYLWHQPVLVFARTQHLGPLTPGTVAIVFGLVLLLSILSWRFVEKPFRGIRKFGFGAKLAQGLAVIAVVATGFLLQTHVLPSSGAPDRLEPEVISALAGQSDYPMRDAACMWLSIEETLPLDSPCRLGERREKLDFILIGDSFAEALAPGISMTAQWVDKSGVFWGVPACTPILGTTGTWFKSRELCAAFKESMVEQAALQEPEMVILHGTWYTMNLPELIGAPGASQEETIALFGAALKRTIRSFQDRGIEVFIVHQLPSATFSVPDRLAKAVLLGLDQEIFVPLPYNWEMDPMNVILRDPEVMQGAGFFEPADVFCDSTRCIGAIGGNSLFRDHAHITGFAARYLVPSLRAAIWP